MASDDKKTTKTDAAPKDAGRQKSGRGGDQDRNRRGAGQTRGKARGQ